MHTVVLLYIPHSDQMELQYMEVQIHLALLVAA